MRGESYAYLTKIDAISPGSFRYLIFCACQIHKILMEVLTVEAKLFKSVSGRINANEDRLNLTLDSLAFCVGEIYNQVRNEYRRKPYLTVSIFCQFLLIQKDKYQDSG